METAKIIHVSYLKSQILSQGMKFNDDGVNSTLFTDLYPKLYHRLLEPGLDAETLNFMKYFFNLSHGLGINYLKVGKNHTLEDYHEPEIVENLKIDGIHTNENECLRILFTKLFNFRCFFSLKY